MSFHCLPHPFRGVCVGGGCPNVEVNGGHTKRGSLNLHDNTQICPLHGMGNRRLRPGLLGDQSFPGRHSINISPSGSKLGLMELYSLHCFQAGIQKNGVKKLIPWTAGEQVRRGRNPKRNKKEKQRTGGSLRVRPTEDCGNKNKSRRPFSSRANTRSCFPPRPVGSVNYLQASPGAKEALKYSQQQFQNQLACLELQRL